MNDKDKIKAKSCDYLGSNHNIHCSDEQRDVCLAHLDSGRVFPCSILYHEDTFIGHGLGGCVDYKVMEGKCLKE